MEQALPLLNTQVRHTRLTLLRVLAEARTRIMEVIRRLARHPSLAFSGNVRESGLAQVGSEYLRLGRALDEWIIDLVKGTTKAIYNDTIKKLDRPPKLTEFSQRHLEDYMRIVSEPNGPSLAGVFSENMRRRDIASLRRTLIDVQRLGAASGMTRKQIQREMRRRLLGTGEAGPTSWRFIDSAGREWHPDNYLNMLNRTTQATIARETMIDTMIAEGFDLASIQNGGNPCPFCSSWQGVIVSVSGKDPRLPTVADAKRAGVWHSNCVCTLEIVDTLIHAEKIANQLKVRLPRGTDVSREQWRAWGLKIAA